MKAAQPQRGGKLLLQALDACLQFGDLRLRSLGRLRASVLFEALDPFVQLRPLTRRVRALLLDTPQARVEVEIHVALALLRVLQAVAQHLELAAQLADISLQRLDLVHQLDDARIARGVLRLSGVDRNGEAQQRGKVRCDPACRRRGSHGSNAGGAAHGACARTGARA